MIDLLHRVIPLLSFRSTDDFYYLQILQRKKENPQLGSNSRVVKNYYIKSVGELEALWPEITLLCQGSNARAMLRLNRRSFRKVAFKTMQNLANLISNEEYSFARRVYDRACGDGHNDDTKTWIIDLDGEISDRYVDQLLKVITESQPVGDKLVIELPTKNGVHLVVRPFDMRAFRELWPTVDIHKDNPINLYIP